MLEKRALLSTVEPPCDFLALGATQPAVYQPSTSGWVVDGPNGRQTLGAFGAPNLADIPVPGDYDGVGHAELAVFRPSTAQWLVLGPSGGHILGPFGAPNLFDIPAPGDYDGVGHTELAVFRPSTAQWLVLGPRGGHILGPFGAPNLFDIPVPGDYDGVGHAELAVFRPSTAQWLVLGPKGGKILATFGAPNLFDIPVPGDWDHVGHVEPAVYRVSTGQIFVLGPGGGHLLTTFGAPNYAEIPLQAPLGALRRLGISPPAPTTNTWTIMVYMEADNSLAPFAGLNIMQMESAAAKLPGSVHFAVYLHQEKDPNTGQPPVATGNGTQVWTGSGEAVLVPKASTQVVTRFDTSLGDQNTGLPSTLARFVTWAAAAAPAQHYALVVWGHGFGYKGVAYHDTNLGGTDHLSVSNLAAGLKSAITQLPVTLDLLAFDACDMMATEVIDSLHSLVGVVLGPEGDVPGEGYPYDTCFSILATSPGKVSATSLAGAIIQSVTATYAQFPDETQSQVSLSQVTALDSALRTFTTAALPATGVAAQALVGARDQAAILTGDFANFIDLGLYMKALVANPSVSSGVQAAAQGVLNALAAMVLGLKADQFHSTGLTIYAPVTGAPDPAYLAEYASFLTATGWDAFLTKFF